MNVYDAIFKRRDIRDFKPDRIPDNILYKILKAAHSAGSVGFMQPWNFIIIRSTETRKRVFDVFEQENKKASKNYKGKRRALYDSLKLQGILDSPINIAVTCDHSRKGPHVIGRNSIRDTDIYSTCCAIQNLWLAARAEGIGVGWVSILRHNPVNKILGIPKNIFLVAYLCVGYPVEFRNKPLLEEIGWEKHIPLKDVIFQESWQGANCQYCQ